MRFGNDLKIALTFIGTLIGAGFASGQEIALYFGDTAVISPLLAGVFCGTLAFLFCEIGRITRGEILENVFPETQRIWKYGIAVCNFFVLSAMVAGAEFVLLTTFGYAGGGLLTGLVALGVVLSGSRGIKAVNALVVPAIVGIIITVFALRPSANLDGRITLAAPALYSTMNILTGGFLIARLSKENSRKDNFFISAVCALILSALLVILYFIVKSTPSGEMPVLIAANAVKLGKVGGILIYLAIFTTAIGSFSVISEGNVKLSLAALAGAYLVSLAGFSTIVEISYPVVGVLGAAFTAAVIIYLFKTIKSRKRLLLY